MYYRASWSYFNLVNRDRSSEELPVLVVDEYSDCWFSSLWIYFGKKERNNENRSSIFLLKTFLQLSYPVLDTQRSWLVHERASGVVSITCPSARAKCWDHCSVQVSQAGSACPVQWAVATGSEQLSTGPGRKCLSHRGVLKRLGGWGTQVDCFLCMSVEAWKTAGVGGYGQGSGDLRSVYERFRCVWSRSQSCTSC